MNQESKNQFALLRKKRFAPLFFTQFFGAYNDNVFKNAIILIIAYQSTSMLSSDVLINIAAGLFILPFFLFSALAGQVADKQEKSKLVKRIKLLEVFIMVSAALAFCFDSILGLLLLLFLMGTQSAFFGPVKYSILPQQLKPDELISGNALVEMGTFVAILLGTISGGLLVRHTDHSIIGIVVISVALLGWLVSRRIPIAEASSPDLKVSFNLFSQTWKTIKSAKSSKPVFLSMLAISWFWFLGASYLTQFPNFTKSVLNGSESVVTILLACFSIGIGLGSLLCESLSGKKVELGLVPLGAIGLTVFGIDLCFAFPAQIGSQVLSPVEFLKTSGGLHVVADLILIGIFGGFYTVPLYAYIQKKTPASNRARAIAANNILNAFFMVAAAISGVLLLGILNLSIIQYFFLVAIFNLAVAAYIFTVIPEFFLRFVAWVLSRLMYRTSIKGLSNLPEVGPAVIVCNHVSFVDWLLIFGASRRPVRFVMYEPIYRIPVLHWFFKAAKTIPIQSKKVSPKNYIRAFKEMQATLENGKVLCIFPEGKITTDGQVDEFKGGIEKIIKTTPVPVVPMAISGMYGSFFSRKYGNPFSSFPKRFWSRVNLNIGSPVLPDLVSIALLRHQVVQLKVNYQI